MSNLLRETIRAILEQYVLVEHISPQAYERIVIRSIKQAGIGGRIKRATTHDAWRPDADMKIDGQYHYVEVKTDGHAQMGSGSVAYRDGLYHPAGDNFELSQDVAETLNDLNDTSLRKGIKRLLAFLSTKEKRFVSVPFSGFDNDRWEIAKKSGLLLPINRTFQSNVSAIAQHYARKNTYYIQIGGAGLFRLGEENPANLPVPRLEGKVQLELRAGKSDVGKASLRITARLLTRNMSPYTLDDVDSIKQMLRDRR